MRVGILGSGLRGGNLPIVESGPQVRHVRQARSGDEAMSKLGPFCQKNLYSDDARGTRDGAAPGDAAGWTFGVWAVLTHRSQDPYRLVEPIDLRLACRPVPDAGRPVGPVRAPRLHKTA